MNRSLFACELAPMRQTGNATSAILEASASPLASYAAQRLLEEHPDIAGRFGPAAFSSWRDQLAQMLRELAAAIGADEPGLFRDHLSWTASAFGSRDLPALDLVTALDQLRRTIADELAPHDRDRALEVIDLAIPALDGHSAPSSASGVERPPNEVDKALVAAYLEAVFEGDRRRAIDLIVGALGKQLSVKDAYLRVLAPAQEQIGAYWHAGDISVAEEHFATDTTRSLMTILLEKSDRAPSHGKVAIGACVAGNAHDMGLRAVGDFLEMDGWRVIHLGADVPTEDLLAAATQYGADLIVLSAALSTQIRSVADAIEMLHALDRPSRLPVLVGGGVFDQRPELWRKVGADAYAKDPPAAVESARALASVNH